MQASASHATLPTAGNVLKSILDQAAGPEHGGRPENVICPGCGREQEPFQITFFGETRWKRPAVPCRECEERNEAEERERREAGRSAAFEKALPELLRSCGVGVAQAREALRVAPLMKPLSETAVFLSGTGPKPGLMLWGNAGIGKTTRAIVGMAELLRRGRRPLFVTVPDLFLELRATFADRLEAAATEKGVVMKYLNAEVLILDDLAAKKGSAYTSEILFSILDGRKNSGRPTIITADRSLDEIRSNFGEEGKRLVERIIEACAVVNLTGPNYRHMGARGPKPGIPGGHE